MVPDEPLPPSGRKIETLEEDLRRENLRLAERIAKLEKQAAVEAEELAALVGDEPKAEADDGSEVWE
jgi:hypothetical protein